MLGQRILTAIALLAILLPALFASQPEWFMLVALVLITVACWEWGRLNGYHGKLAWITALEGLGFCALMWKFGWPAMKLPQIWLIAGSLWIAIGAWLIHRGVAGWAHIPKAIRVAGGLMALCLAWLAIAQARVISNQTIANMKRNLAFACVYNALGIPLAADLMYPFTSRLLSPMIEVPAASLSAVSVTGNALRLRNRR